jgi:hypothetical protein
MAAEKDGSFYWVREQTSGDVAGPFTVAQVNEYVKKLPKEKLKGYAVKSSKWPDWKPLTSVIKGGEGASASPPPAAPSRVPPAIPKLAPKAAKPPAPKISSTSSDSGLWTANPDSNSDSDIRTEGELESPVLTKGEDSDDPFSDALASAENVTLESSISVTDRAKISNSRQYPRFRVDVEVTFIGTNGESFVTKTRDLSLGGMQFEHPVPLNFFEDSALVSLFYRVARQRFTANLMPIAADKNVANRAVFNYLSPKNSETLHEWLKSGEAKAVPDSRLAALQKKKRS